MWPAENRTPKPTLEQVTPPASIRQKVDNYLRESEALDAYWHRPITGEQLQAEMDRMARQTKKAALLEELRAALGNDPDVIAECLARPALVNRLIRNWYAADERYHGALKRRAEEERRIYATPGQMQRMSGEYRELEWVKRGAQEESVPGNSVALGSEQWD